MNPFNWSLMHDCKHVVIAARKLDESMHHTRRTSKEKSWMSRAAEDLGVELSEESGDDDGDGGTHARKMHADGVKREKRTIGCRIAATQTSLSSMTCLNHSCCLVHPNKHTFDSALLFRHCDCLIDGIIQHCPIMLYIRQSRCAHLPFLILPISCVPIVMPRCSA